MPRELKLWSKYGHQVQLCEKKQRDPNDVLLKAERQHK